MTPEQIAALAAEHVYPSYATVADEVHAQNPVCSCGLHNCPVPALLADIDALTFEVECLTRAIGETT